MILSSTILGEPVKSEEAMITIPKAAFVELVEAYKAQKAANILLYQGLRDTDEMHDKLRSGGMVCT